MIVWGFWGGDKGEGSTQNVKNYGIEVPSKTAGLYLVPKLRNLIFWDFAGFGGFLGGFGGIFGVSKVWGVCRTRGRIGFEVLVKTQGLYQLPKLRKLIFFVFLAVQGSFCGLFVKNRFVKISCSFFISHSIFEVAIFLDTLVI